VQTGDSNADKLRALVPKARFEVAHGQMVEKQLERAMMRFIRKEIDVLVCTTIIESGLDIPSANTSSSTKSIGSAWGRSIMRPGGATGKAYAYLFLSNGPG
jgi:transcription-repair coupling factor (superfamily II helicase)